MDKPDQDCRHTERHTITTFDNTAERSLYAFLADEGRRNGSRRTVEGYSRTLQHFFGSVGTGPDPAS